MFSLQRTVMLQRSKIRRLALPNESRLIQPMISQISNDHVGNSSQPSQSIITARSYSSRRPASFSSVSLSGPNAARRRRVGGRVPSSTVRSSPARSSVVPPTRVARGSSTAVMGAPRGLADTTTSSGGDSTKSNGGKLFPVSAIHLAQTIDLEKVFSTSIFARDFVKKQMFHKNSFVVQLPPHSPNDPPRYVAVFRFGSLVCINMSPRERSNLVAAIKKHSTEPVLEGFERKERFGVMLQPNEEGIFATYDGSATVETTLVPHPHSQHNIQVTGDYCVVPELDMNGVAVISNIMAQTVALDSYNDMVDDMLSKFAKINSTVTKNGKFHASHKQFLFQTFAKNNAIFIDMISKIRIKDRSDTAWNLTKYEDIHYALRDEFEIDDRFDHIEFKLNLIQQNAKFFLEVLQSQKSNSLEWIIVALIAVECVIMCTDMSGLGESVVAPFIEQLWRASG